MKLSMSKTPMVFSFPESGEDNSYLWYGSTALQQQAISTKLTCWRCDSVLQSATHLYKGVPLLQCRVCNIKRLLEGDNLTIEAGSIS